RKEIHYHLKKYNYGPLDKFSEPQPDTLFIQRLLESLLKSYNSMGFSEKEDRIKKLLELFEI
ncbi:MAG: hypothetical protein R3182_10345, partial [Draconibacterium sp.]|nr:hypothetical protein [Draconibacterium sp.]